MRFIDTMTPDQIDVLKLKGMLQDKRMAFADHVYEASEPRVEDTMTAEDRKEQFGEECAYCGKNSWTCEHFKPEDNQ